MRNARMQIRRLILGGCTSLLLATSLAAQSFVNLGFESAVVSPTPPGGSGGSVDPTVAFPGWTAAAPLNLYNNLTIGAPAQILIGPAFPNAIGFTALSGSYSAAVLFNGAALSQTGTVPAGTNSINFLSQSGQVPLVSLGGTPITIFDLGGGRYGGTVTSFAGQNVTLSFQPSVFGIFDDIAFSPQVVPEPSSLALLAVACGAAALRFRRGRI